ncbi:hypothetical protein D3C71_1860450 [compost metagenome]
MRQGLLPMTKDRLLILFPQFRHQVVLLIEALCECLLLRLQSRQAVQGIVFIATQYFHGTNSLRQIDRISLGFFRRSVY